MSSEPLIVHVMYCFVQYCRVIFVADGKHYFILYFFFVNFIFFMFYIISFFYSLFTAKQKDGFNGFIFPCNLQIEFIR